MEHFYGKEIHPDEEKAYIQKILSKYRKEPVSDELKRKIYNDLVAAKEKGEISIPFKVVYQKEHGTKPACIEILLDTKV